MLGLGTSLITSPTPSERVPFDRTYTFTSSSDVSAWGIGNAARIDSISYVASQPLGGVSYSNLMKITMVSNGPTGSGFVRFANAFDGVPDGVSLKIEVDYGIGKNNDVTLRIASLSLGGTFKTVDGSDQSSNTFRQVAPVTASSLGSTNNDLAIYIPADTGLSAGDVIYVQRIRVYEP